MGKQPDPKFEGETERPESDTQATKIEVNVAVSETPDPKFEGGTKRPEGSTPDPKFEGGAKRDSSTRAPKFEG